MSLKSVEQELKQLQKQTASDQKNWRSQKGVLVREISALQVKKTDLEERYQRLTRQVKEGNSKLDKQIEDYDALKVFLDETNAKIKRATAKLKTLEARIAQKQAEIDTKLEAYQKQRRQAVDEQIKAKTDGLAELEIKTSEAINNLGAVNNQIKDLKASEQARIDGVAQEVNKLEAALSNRRSEAEKLGQTVEELQVLIEELKAERKQLLFERDQAISDTNKARIEYEQFIKYEQKARDALNAKDKSLQLREDEVEKSSVLMRNARSNLPPM